MGNNYSHNYGYNPFMPYSPNYGGYTLPAQFYGPDPQLVNILLTKFFFNFFKGPLPKMQPKYNN